MHSYRDALATAGLTVRFVAVAEALAAVFIADWTVGVVVLDLGLATPTLAARLDRDGPRVLAFGDPAHAGLALTANLAGFIDDMPIPDELVAAIRAAADQPAAPGFAELSDRAAARLGALGAEAERMTAALAQLTDRGVAATPPPIYAALVRGLVKARRGRERFFAPEIFADPAWDMLLDLSAANAEGHLVSVSSLCIAACVPSTTALRWIKTLCDAGLFERTSDPTDARRAFIGLSDETVRAMAAYLAAFAQPGS